MTKKILDTKDNIDKIAVDILVSSIKTIFKKQDKLVLGVPGGRSVVGIFRLLKDTENIPWEKVHLFMVDERLVPLNHKDSNFRVVKEILLDELLKRSVLPEVNIHPFVANKSTIDSCISKYENEIIKFGGAYDIILLGVGEDGHVASLFPNHHSIMNETPFYLSMYDSPKPPPHRMTMSKNLLLKSKVAIMVITGESKRAAYSNFLNVKVDSIHCPAKLALLIKDSYIVSDLKL